MTDIPGSKPLTRRRFLCISAAAAGTALACGPVTAAPTLHSWRGIALGAQAQMLLNHPDQAHATATFRKMEAEIRRLEKIFSLYDAESELSRLNRDGVLTSPSNDMLQLLSQVRTIHAATEGAFDPTIQPLWDLYARSASIGRSPTASEIQAVLGAVGLKNVRIEPQSITFTKDRMALTLNGIAQGYITDRISDLLRTAGFDDILVNLGEISAFGDGSDGETGWPVSLRPDPVSPLIATVLQNRSLATSNRYGTTFDQDGTLSHILDPRTGYPASADLVGISVLCPNASIADGLSTAGLVCGETALVNAARAFDEVEILGVRETDGKVRRLG